MSAAAGSGPPAEGPRGREWALAFAPALALILLIALHARFTIDDAFITFRYARHLAAGFGLAWNPGAPPVEGYSNLSFVALSALCLRLGLDPVTVTRWICVASAVLCVPLTFALGRRAGLGAGLAAFGALLLALSAGFAFWAVAGLETTFYTALVAGGTYLFLAEDRGKDLAATALFLVASITRPEAPVLLAALGLVRLGAGLAAREGPGAIVLRNLPWAAFFTLAYGAYFLSRWAYFGHPFPNPIYFKLGEGAGSFGETVAADFLRNWAPLLLAALLSISGADRRRASLLVLVAAAILVNANATRTVAGTVSTMGFFDRFFMPVLPMLCASAAAGVGVAARSSIGRVAAPLAAAALLAWQVAAPDANARTTVSWARTYGTEVEPQQQAAGEYLNRRFGAAGRAAVGDVGLIGYVFRGSILDLYGLNSYAFTRQDKKDFRKYLPRLLGERPDAFVFVAEEKGGAVVAHHAVDKVLMQHPDFQAAYVLAETFRHPESRYFYAVYERRGE